MGKIEIKKNKFLFICGLHRSGTSLLYEILKNQNDTSGFSNTQAIEDEGQHLQSVYKAANKTGGPGKFGFNNNSFLDENSHLISNKNREKLFHEWSKYWDLSKKYLVEKSPPNLIRTRFLQAMFPNSYFITILRDPIATSLATKKWSKTSHFSLIKHWLICHKKYLSDKEKLENSLEIKYEDLISKPKKTLEKIEKFLKIKIKFDKNIIKKNVNDKYFTIWKKNRKNIFYYFNIRKCEKKFESEINKFGYSFNNI